MTDAGSTSSPPFTLVVGVEFTDASGFALDQAVRVARRIEGSRLHAVHVIGESADDAVAKTRLGQLRTYLEEKFAFLGGFAGHKVGVHIRRGKAESEIAGLADEIHADLLIVGGGKGALKNLFAGSVAEKLVKDAPCPVLVAGAPPPVSTATPAPTPWWNTDRHPRAHVYSYENDLPFHTHDSEVTATGVDEPR